MKTKHTPGPWFYDFGADSAYITEDDGTLVAELQTTLNTTARADLEANARLMAAAPDLLATLRYISGRLPAHDTKSIANAEAAIYKATGEKE